MSGMLRSKVLDMKCIVISIGVAVQALYAAGCTGSQDQGRKSCRRCGLHWSRDEEMRRISALD